MQAFGAVLVVSAYFLLSITSFLIYSIIAQGMAQCIASGLQNLLIVGILLVRGGFVKKIERPKSPGRIFFRSLTGVMYSYCYYSALKYASFAEVGVLTNSFPLFIVLIAWLVFKERVFSAQWVALGLGIVGVWTILFSNALSFWNVGVFYATAASVFLAIAMIIMQKVSQFEDVHTYLLTFFTFNSLLLSPLIMNVFVMPTTREFLFCLVGAALTLVAQFLLFSAYKICSASELAPYHFSFALFHFLLAKGLFAFVPTVQFYIGASLIFLGGVVNLVLFERKGLERKQQIKGLEAEVTETTL